jgi:hypothetical protein
LRKVLWFTLQFLPLFVVFFVLYLLILPYYQPLAVGAANAITLEMSPPTHLEVTDKGWAGYVFNPQEGQVRLRGWSQTTTVHLVFLSMVTLPALLLATPAPWRMRLRLLAWGLPLMFVGHVIALCLTTRGVQCLQEQPGTFVCLWALRVSYASGQIFAATFWIMLTWRYWFEAAGTTVTAEAASDPPASSPPA